MITLLSHPPPLRLVPLSRYPLSLPRIHISLSLSLYVSLSVPRQPFHRPFHLYLIFDISRTDPLSPSPPPFPLRRRDLAPLSFLLPTERASSTLPGICIMRACATDATTFSTATSPTVRPVRSSAVTYASTPDTYTLLSDLSKVSSSRVPAMAVHTTLHHTTFRGDTLRIPRTDTEADLR